MKYFLIVSLVFVLMSNFLHARKAKQEPEPIEIGTEIPSDPSGVPKKLQRNRFEQSTVDNSDMYKKAQIQRVERKMILTEIFDPDILMQPISRVIRPIDSIGVTPEYITTILFPNNMEIKDAKTSFNTVLFEFNRNLLRFRPEAQTFYAGNMVITLSDGKKNYEMSIHVSRYYQKDCSIKSNQYICWKMRKEWTESKSTKEYPYAYNNLSVYYTYKNAQILESMDVISIYEKLKNHPLDLPRDGDFDVILYKGVSYRIIRDDTFGEIYYRAHKYRVVVGS